MKEVTNKLIVAGKQHLTQKRQKNLVITFSVKETTIMNKDWHSINSSNKLITQFTIKSIDISVYIY